MRVYEIRLDYADGYEIARVEAGSIAEAYASPAVADSGAESTTLLGSVGTTPETFLAW